MDVRLPALCIHGHFYQPPRENPWLEGVERQDSAAPYHDWNERVCAECYAPNAHARILDGENFIRAIRNNYARISFNFGPTLLSWLQRFAPGVYAALIQADRESRERLEHGNAIAQGYSHMILPLAHPRDLRTQIAWGLRDFEQRFGRKAEGMWLPETAANLATLEALAEAGIQFTILAPHQAHRVRRIGARGWKEVGGGIDPSRAYQAALPSRRKLALFFYDGPIARAVAFEGLLDDGGRFAERLLSAADPNRKVPQLLHIATDGESYGHHHKHGEMALAYALDTIESGGKATLTNYATFLAAHPPTHEVEIWENSSWSCVHGVERWRSDCGCNSGGKPGWNQKWRAPLRQALDWLRDQLAPLYEAEAGKLLRRPWEARDQYIEVVLERRRARAFLESHAPRSLRDDEITRALELLELQRHAMLMYTSCGWFFDEISGLETVQVLQYAGRALQLAAILFPNGAELEEGFLARLEAAPSNLPEQGNGRAVYERYVRPARVTLAQVGAHYAVSSLFEEYADQADIYGFTVHREEADQSQSGRMRFTAGRIRVESRITLEAATFSYGILHLGDHNLSGGVRPYQGEAAYRAMRAELEQAFGRAEVPELLRRMERDFGPAWNAPPDSAQASAGTGGTYSLRLLFRDEQRKILDRVLAASREEAEGAYRQLYEHHASLLRFLRELHVPAPRHLTAAAHEALRLELYRAIEAAPLDPERLRRLAEEASGAGIEIRPTPGLSLALGRALARLAADFHRKPEKEALRAFAHAARVMAELHFGAELGPAQDLYFDRIPLYWQKAALGDEATRAWCQLFEQLGHDLRIHIPAPVEDTDVLVQRAS